jgi:hypothetical protein
MFILSNSCLKLEENFKSIYYKSASHYKWMKNLFYKSYVSSKGSGNFTYPFCKKHLFIFSGHLFTHGSAHECEDELSFHTRLASQYQHFRIQLEMHTKVFNHQSIKVHPPTVTIPNP